jgi:uncharacterized protein YyaL (SSP411 family)
MTSMHEIVRSSLAALEQFCEAEEYKGWDPYDGLNSYLFKSLPFISKNRLIRLGWIQFFKRSPINFRKIAFVKKEFNSKGLGLFLTGYCNLYSVEQKPQYLEKIDYFSKKLLQLQSVNYNGSCWGYNFDWQARAFFQPKNTPTVVASAFVANALLNAFEITKIPQLLNTASSTCNFILKDLNRTYSKQGNFCFSYSPLDKTAVFNASLLASQLLARVYSFTGEKKLIDEAKKSVQFCCDHQQENGAWAYGTLPFHQWIDNFHTGYNIESIADYMKYAEDNAYCKNVKKGFDYYIHTFFTKEGIPKYYNNSTYPIDIHASAELIITLVKLNQFDVHKKTADAVLRWTINNMQSPEGYFYYQKNRFFSSKIPYMRWAQAWMFYALSTYLKTNE